MMTMKKLASLLIVGASTFALTGAYGKNNVNITE